MESSRRRSSCSPVHLGSGASAALKVLMIRGDGDCGARPPVALRGKPGGRAPRHPVRNPSGDACRWASGRREGLSLVDLGPGTSAVFKGLMTRGDSDCGARPPVALRGKPGGRAPRRPGHGIQESLVDGVREVTVPASIMVHHDGTRGAPSLSPAVVKCSGFSRARRRGEGPTQTVRSLGSRTVCSCPSVSLGNTSTLREA